MQTEGKKITYFQGGIEGMNGFGTQWVRFTKDMPKRNIKEGQISKTHIQKMKYIEGIQVFPVYGEPDYFFSVKSEEELLELLEPLTQEEAEEYLSKQQ
jgi:hypothetical protein